MPLRSMAHYFYGAVTLARFRDEKRDAPDCTQSDECVDNTAENARLSAADPRHEIKLEYSDRSPVYAADYQQNKSDPV